MCIDPYPVAPFSPTSSTPAWLGIFTWFFEDDMGDADIVESMRNFTPTVKPMPNARAVDDDVFFKTFNDYNRLRGHSRPTNTTTAGGFSYGSTDNEDENEDSKSDHPGFVGTPNVGAFGDDFDGDGICGSGGAGDRRMTAQRGQSRRQLEEDRMLEAQGRIYDRLVADLPERVGCVVFIHHMLAVECQFTYTLQTL